MQISRNQLFWTLLVGMFLAAFTGGYFVWLYMTWIAR